MINFSSKIMKNKIGKWFQFVIKIPKKSLSENDKMILDSTDFFNIVIKEIKEK